MNATNTAALNKLASLFSVTPERNCWSPEYFTGTINAMDQRLRLYVGRDFVQVSECADNGRGCWIAQRSTVVPKGLSFAKIVEWIRTWIDNKPVLPDGTYRISGRDTIYMGPVLNNEQSTYLMSIAHASLGAYPLGGSIEIKNGKRGGVWGSI